MEIKIRRSIPNDIYGIRDVQMETWLNTYPNRKAGITLKDITLGRFLKTITLPMVGSGLRKRKKDI